MSWIPKGLLTCQSERKRLDLFDVISTFDNITATLKYTSLITITLPCLFHWDTKATAYTANGTRTVYIWHPQCSNCRHSILDTCFIPILNSCLLNLLYQSWFNFLVPLLNFLVLLTGPVPVVEKCCIRP